MKSLLSTCSKLQYYRLIKFCIGFCHVFELHTPAWETTQIGAVVSYADAILIHVPTRGATMRIEIAEGVEIISIHAPTQGATWAS